MEMIDVLKKLEEIATKSPEVAKAIAAPAAIIALRENFSSAISNPFPINLS